MSEINPEEPITGEYQGPTACEARYLWEYAQEVKNGTELNLYEEIIRAVSEVKNAGRKKCVILDLGCGRDWNVGLTLFPGTRNSVFSLQSPIVAEEEFIQEKPSLKRLDEELEKLNMVLEVIGLTDAQKGELSTVLWSGQDERYSVRKVAYTLTNKQILGDFLNTHVGRSTECVDLVLAIQSLEYLKPEVFEQTVLEAS